MRILFQHPGIFPVQKYGGTERIIFWLMKKLAQLGHDIFFIGHPKCQLKNFNINHIPQKNLDWRNQIPPNTDLIHLSYVPPLAFEYPLLLTVHGNARPGEIFPSNSVFVSKAHANFHGANHFVYNAIDFDEYPFLAKKNSSLPPNHFLFLAKASWKVKNLSDCVKACRQIKKHLHIAGGRTFSLSPYIHSYGIVDQEKKLDLLRKSDTLLFPVKWSEPFGIAIIEAFSQGLPVIASAYGALPELIQKSCGVICENYEQFLHALQKPLSNFYPEEIRHYAETNFNTEIMAQNYLQYYERIIAGETLHLNPIGGIYQKSPEDLLPF